MQKYTSRGRVLVVEDDLAIAEELIDALNYMNFETIGPFRTSDDALAAIADGAPNAAILDVRLANGVSFPVARRLRDIGVPFLFMTGSVNEVIDEFAFAPALKKPVRLAALFAALDGILMRQAA